MTAPRCSRAVNQLKGKEPVPRKAAAHGQRPPPKISPPHRLRARREPLPPSRTTPETRPKRPVKMKASRYLRLSEGRGAQKRLLTLPERLRPNEQRRRHPSAGTRRAARRSGAAAPAPDILYITMLRALPASLAHGAHASAADCAEPRTPVRARRASAPASSAGAKTRTGTSTTSFRGRRLPRPWKRTARAARRRTPSLTGNSTRPVYVADPLWL